MPDQADTKHDAVADARYQAMLVQKTLAELHKKKLFDPKGDSTDD